MAATWTDEWRIEVAERFADHRIFVSLVAFRDRHLAATIQSALDAADRPARVRFGICHLFDEETAGVLDGYADDPRVAVDRIRFDEGGASARARANQWFDSERYALQLDGPTIFTDGWDRRLIDLLRSAGSARPIITGGPLPATPARDRDVVDTAPAASPPGLVPTPRLAAGELLFSDGRFLVDVPADPELPAGVDDLELSIRAYTHGYDVFCVSEPVVHRRQGSVAPLPDATDDADGGPPPTGTGDRPRPRADRAPALPGVGVVRTVAAFEDFVGRDLRARSDRLRPLRG